MDISSLKAKRRYEINKGNKNFYSKVINLTEHFADIYEVTIEAYSAYPKKYRPSIDKDKFLRDLSLKESEGVFIGIFDRLSNRLKGYAYLVCYDDYINYSMHKVIPSEEKRGINAALVFGVLKFYADKHEYRYITDGERAIRHETKFQDYLIKYFGFRRAYCKLNVEYNPLIKYIISLLYPFREILFQLKNNNFLYNIYCVLEQERIRRTFL